jgi:hypothetical protein
MERGCTMLGLVIRDKVRWHYSWSSEIGEKLNVVDSTENMYIFDEKHSKEEILGIIEDAPQDLYELLELETAPQDSCDFLLDSGRCYNKRH